MTRLEALIAKDRRSRPSNTMSALGIRMRWDQSFCDSVAPGKREIELRIVNVLEGDSVLRNVLVACLPY